MDIQQAVRAQVDRHAGALDRATVDVLVELCEVGEWRLAFDELVAALHAQQAQLTDAERRDLADLLTGLGKPADQLDW